MFRKFAVLAAIIVVVRGMLSGWGCAPIRPLPRPDRHAHRA